MTRTIEEAIELVESFAALQEMNSPKYTYPCPRCGRDTMNGVLTRNALSRRVEVFICDACGTAEALEALMNEQGIPPMLLNEWALCTTIDTLQVKP